MTSLTPPPPAGDHITLAPAAAAAAPGDAASAVTAPVGHLAAPSPDGDAVLEVLEAEDSILQDFAIPTRAAFDWWYRILKLRVTGPS
ncbi:hypothetical protein GCM10010411_75360 [Actinomadura fulvescens]|uniref:Uncharacterized protein n=1 Tax=Actinomadura fulvescens TaxID=46160 RepID=A0ABN3QJT8_9ACTN